VLAERARYHVYDGGSRYLLVAENRRKERTYNVSLVDAKYVEQVRRRFRGKDTTTIDVRKKLGSRGFRPLQSLVVLIARGEGSIRRRGRPILFHVNARKSRK
jgi:hypothetical protein